MEAVEGKRKLHAYLCKSFSTEALDQAMTIEPKR